MSCGLLRKFFVALIFFISMSAISVAHAVDIRVGVIDFQKVIESSSAYRDIKSQLDKKTDEFRASAAKIEEELQKSYQDLESKKTVYSAENYSKEKGRLDKRVESSQEKFHIERLSLDKASSQAMSILEKGFFEVVEQNAKSRGLSVIIPNSSLLYSDPSLDMTDAVIEELNKKLPSVTVVFEDKVVATGKSGKAEKK